MEEFQLIGQAISTVITLGAFLAVIMKFTQPINDLRVVIQKLNDNIDSMKKDSEKHEKSIGRHEDKLNDHENRIVTLETKVGTYHKHDE